MGDIMGSLAIADMFRDRHRTEDIIFMVENDPETLEVISEKNYRIETVNSFDQEINYIKEITPHVIIVNMLKNEEERLKIFRQHTKILVTIDDSSRAARWAHIKINPLYYLKGALNDPSYVALKKEFITAGRQKKIIHDKVEAILITQGGSDTYGFTPKIIKSLNAIGKNCQINVVIGPAFKHHKELHEEVNRSMRDFNVIYNPKNMCRIMQQSDLAITAGGNTMFELACLGVPGLVICGEEFEEETADRMDSWGVMVNLGFGLNVSEKDIFEKTQSLMRDKNRRLEMSRSGQRLVDGRGAEKIVALIKNNLNQQLSPLIAT